MEMICYFYKPKSGLYYLKKICEIVTNTITTAKNEINLLFFMTKYINLGGF